MAMAFDGPSRSDPRQLIPEYESRYPVSAFPSAPRPPSSLVTPVITGNTASSDFRPDSLHSPSASYDRRSNLTPSPSRATSRRTEPSVEEQSLLPQETILSSSSSNVETTGPPVQFPPQQRNSQLMDRPISQMMDSAPRHPNLPAAGVGTSPSAPFQNPIIPLSAAPSYTPPPIVSQSPRVTAQQPIYITQSAAPNALNPVFSPAPARQEEVCVECAMRDQDMADVDVLSPGAWERESDAAFEDLKRRDIEDEANGIPPAKDRPRLKGHHLTEKHVKIWLSINPREPQSKHKNLHIYVKSQQSLIEKEALAHAQAQQEARQLDNRMRDTYSQLRRSAYDMGSSAAPVDDTGAVRIRPPPTTGGSSRQNPPHLRSHSRDVTLLENGMIVEHVDVRREERDVRDRRRKEEKRVRKSSRSSTYDVTSLISNGSYMPQTDSGIGLGPYSRYSQASLGRPMSVLTNGERPELPRAYSQASFSDIHSLNSGSPRRSRFFGNLGSGFRSQNSLAPSGFSGSMVDMHMALYDSPHGQRQSVAGIDPSTLRQSQIWAPQGPSADPSVSPYGTVGTQKKKKKGLAKIWNKMTGGSKPGKQDILSSRDTSHTYERQMEDNYQLAPPPSLSYLARETHSRQGSTLSLPLSSHSQKPPGAPLQSLSPSTAASSLLPSPSSSRPPDHPEIAGDSYRTTLSPNELETVGEDTIGKRQSRNVHPATSEPDFRRRVSQAPPPGAMPPVPQSPTLQPVGSFVVREKSLPPLPPDDRSAADTRPYTVHTYDSGHQQLVSSPIQAPQAPFRTNQRRQSFGGVAARPDMHMPQKGVTHDGRRTNFQQAPYNEFGASRHSLGNILDQQRNTASPAPSKRKSKFGLSSLLGKKQTKDGFSDENSIRGLPYTETQESGSARTGSIGMRNSVGSRRALEEVVSQDPEFVAYRYPSGDQRLDLLR